MELYLLPIIGLALVFPLGYLLLRRRRNGDAVVPYCLGHGPFSATDRDFLEVLEQAVGTRHRVFGRVRVADVIDLSPVLAPRLRDAAWTRLQDACFDFLVCDARTLKPVCAVELDSVTRDDPVDDICDSAGFPLLRVPLQRTWSVAEVGLQFDALFAATPSAMGGGIRLLNDVREAPSVKEDVVTLGPARTDGPVVDQRLDGLVP